MSEDLTCTNCGEYVGSPIADRIEELEAQQQKTYQELLKITKIHDEVEAKLAKAEELVKVAFNEGFCEGMDEVQRQRGGKNWYESRSRQRLAELKGKIDEDEI